MKAFNLRTLFAAALLIAGFGIGLNTQPAQARFAQPAIHSSDVQNVQWHHRHWRHGNSWGPRVHWGPRCRWMERRVWSPRLHRHVWRSVRVCR